MIRLMSIFILALVTFMIIFGGIYYFWQKSNNTTSSKSESTVVSEMPSGSETINLPNQITSIDKTVSFSLPKDWIITNKSESQSEFGAVIEHWEITDPTKEISLDIKQIKNAKAIETESTIDCPDKSTFCDEVEINNKEYKKSLVTLNTGYQLILLGRANEEQILLISAMLKSGSEQPKNAQIVEQILQTFK